MQELSILSQYFEKLTRDREENAKILEKQSMKGVKTSVVDKYSDQAHFIYELLQNADDAGAKKAKFILAENGLTFIHNGQVLFSVSDPDNEKHDTEVGKLGHINAITSIANSNKNQSSIGKFGVGFKAVFQYTNTPHIYDGNFKFKIERFIVPKQLESDYPNRNSNETIFFFPFDHLDRPAEKAYQDILNKLQSLNNPLLFLTHLNEITWETNNLQGKYSKKIKEAYTETIKGKTPIVCELIHLNENKGAINTRRKLWLFTRGITNTNHKYSVGFFLNKENKLESTNYSAYCFFPTKETTNLKFIIQAPFLLTDSRENIKAGEDWNKQLVQLLSLLSADSFIILKQIGIANDSLLIDDSIISFIPYKSTDFADLNNTSRISFLPFFNSIQQIFQTDQLLPAKSNNYTSKLNAYWASDEDLAALFTDAQVAQLMGRPNSRWAFPTLGRKIVLNEKENYQSIKANYIDTLVLDNLDPDKLLRRIDRAFIEKQPINWLDKFYTYLINKVSYHQIIKKKPIFINNEKLALSAFDDNNKLVLFLPTKEIYDYPTINEAFLKYPLSLAFFKVFGIENPSLKDEIYNKILPQYKEGFDIAEIEKYKTHFLKFFTYFKDCPNAQIDDYVGQFKELEFVVCKSATTEMLLSSPSYCYYPSEFLIEYFKPKTDTLFVDIDFYREIIGESEFEKFKTFLIKTGVEELPIIYQTKLSINDEERRKKGLTTNYTRYSDVYEKYIDGSQELIKNVSESNSALLWKALCSLIKKHGAYRFKSLLKGEHKYFYSTGRLQEFNSREYYRLIGNKWIFAKDGERDLPSKITLQNLANLYEIDSAESKELMSYLGVVNPNSNLNLSPEQRLRFELGERLFNEGVSAEDLPELLQLLKHKRDSSQTNDDSNRSNNEHDTSQTQPSEDHSDEADKSIDSWIKDPIANAKKKLENDLNNGTIPTFQSSSEFWTEDDTEQVENAGDFITAVVIGNEYKENAQQKKKDQLEKEIEVEVKRQKLIELAGQLEVYSYGWFKVLLELEDNFTAEERVKKNPIRVVFGKAAFDKDNFLILSETPFIPPTIENLGIISLQIFVGDNKTTIEGEIISPQKSRLKVKLSHPEQLNSIDLNLVTRVVVQSSSPDFILEKLKTAFGYLGFDDNQNLKHATVFPANVKFIFGPPGTGKTTFLSWLIGGKNDTPLQLNGRIVTPIMEQKNKRVLILTPTNKAADVIADRIIKNYEQKNDFPSWLIRFGETSILEDNSVFVSDRKLKKWVYSNVALATTIARFPYDYFDVENNGETDRWYLKEFNWDVIVFDEASMIQQAALLFVIFYAQKRNPNVEFIIGGDPFQIPPIFQFEFPYWSYLPEPATDDNGQALLDEKGVQYHWKNDGGNIYSFVGLSKDDSFINPQTEPHPFIVHNLLEQFRSIVPIGALYSHYRYNDQLSHHRTDERMLANQDIAVNNISIPKLELAPINIIHFPVRKYGGVYKQQGMKGSPYHIYSAIFSVELIRYIQSNAVFNRDKGYRIGIISPYAKQNLLISKLIEKVDNGKIEVVTGTVHGFQGDQCDMVIVVLNPPKNISRSPRSFLNKKNIINVAISRAKDKMVILTPFDPDKELSFSNLHQIKRVKWLARNKAECNGWLREFNSMTLENDLWEHANYIDDICATSSHQEVNIYTQATKKYEIRFDENAMDVQVKLNAPVSSGISDVVESAELNPN